MSEQQHISPFAHGNDGKSRLSEDKLMEYLEGKLPPAEQHEIEQWLAEEGMESDAIEGLHGLDPAETKHAVGRLNHNLRKTLLTKKRKRRPLNTDHLTWFAIGLILLIIIAAYIVVRISK